MRKAAGFVLAATLVGLLLVLPSVATAATRNVRIENLEFGPPPHTVYANPGDRVRWTHRDGSTPHTVTAEDGSFDSSDSDTCSPLLDDCMREGDTFNHVFNSVGSFGYRCKVHSSMRGTVKVVPRGAATPSATASSTGPSVPPTSMSPTATGTATATGTGTATVSPTVSPTDTLSGTPRAGGPDDGSSNGRIAVAAVGVLLLSAAGFLVYRRFISPS